MSNRAFPSSITKLNDHKKSFLRKEKTLLYGTSCSKEEMHMLAWKAEEHYICQIVNECSKKDRRTTKTLFEDYEAVIEVANIKCYEIVYSEDENDMSIYLAWSEEDSLFESEIDS